MKDCVRLVPLGGLGEVGMNCLVLEHEAQRLIIDCGVMFADGALGTDIIRPDFSYLTTQPARPTAVVLTHGHEDHIGAIPYLLRELQAPIFGPGHALALVKQRLAQFPDLPRAELLERPPGERYQIGPFTIEPICVTHSIAQATALCIDTPAGRIVHTGDFKIDPTPTEPSFFDARRLSQLGDEGVRLLLSDSTNALVERPSGAESDVAKALERYASAAPERLVVALFASNTHRLGALLAAARASKRRLCLLGRSLHHHLRIAHDLGLVDDAADLLVNPFQASVLPRSQVLLAATGTQAEPNAGLARLARDAHPQLRLDAGDTVVLSSRVIPGHERQVGQLLDALRRKGLRVVDAREDPEVHVSGHAYRDDQRTMLTLTRPEWFIPVHGTFSHLSSHAALAAEHSKTQPLVIEDGDEVELGPSGLAWVQQVATGRIHTCDGRDVLPPVLRDRARLARMGVAMVSICLRDDHLAAPVRLLTRGVCVEDDHPCILSDARDELGRAVSQALARGRLDDESLCADARGTLTQFFRRRMGVRVVSYVLVTRVEAG